MKAQKHKFAIFVERSASHGDDVAHIQEGIKHIMLKKKK